ncbi:MAG TPA: hypothetical protein VMI53_14220 [Opitutaceae bacterium]|nr:hypothetical protein [Opitutaceae bacterium]
MSLRIFAFTVLCFSSLAVVFAQSDDQPDEPDAAPPPLRGKIDGRTYISPTGAFSMTIPVLSELGGSISDTENVVTFEDNFSTHVSVAAFQEDATQRFEDERRGRKDYLIYFFSNFVMPDFQKRSPGAKIEDAVFRPGTADGALIVYTLLPGGSMFAERASLTDDAASSLVAKRGNLLFVKNGYIFVISTELAERVLEHSTYHKSKDEEDEILHTRLLDLMGSMQFNAPADKK